jgi:hypothetical protein
MTNIYIRTNTGKKVKKSLYRPEQALKVPERLRLPYFQAIGT